MQPNTSIQITHILEYAICVNMHSKFYGYLTSLTFCTFSSTTITQDPFYIQSFYLFILVCPPKYMKKILILHTNCKLHLLLQNRCPSSVIGLIFLISVLEISFSFQSFLRKLCCKKSSLPTWPVYCSLDITFYS